MHDPTLYFLRFKAQQKWLNDKSIIWQTESERWCKDNREPRQLHRKIKPLVPLWEK